MISAKEDPQSTPGGEQVLNDILSPLAFRAPHRLRDQSDWVEHIPFAFWLIEQTAPRVIVELGVHCGNSYLAFCQAVQTLQLPARCYAIDTWDYPPESGYGDSVYRDLADYNHTHYAAFSRLVRSTFDDAVNYFEDGSIDLLHVDGVHTYDVAKHDFKTWLPKLSSRAVVFFHDTNVREGPFGVFKLWSELTTVYSDSFEFPHCNGLGVCGVGIDLPPALREFLRLARTDYGAHLIREIYTRLGANCSARFQEQRLRNELAGVTGVAS
jgi:hypothetical protein